MDNEIMSVNGGNNLISVFSGHGMCGCILAIILNDDTSVNVD